MSSVSSRRVPNVNVDLSIMVFEKDQIYVQKTMDTIAAEPTKLHERQYSGLVSAYERSALLSYALGRPLSAVREFIRNAISSFEKGLAVRGTDPPIPGIVVTLQRGDPNRARIKPMHPPGFKDFSLFNSLDSLRAAYLAMILGDFAAAVRIACQAYDPPGQPYVGSGRGFSVTVGEQRLSYAARKYFEGDNEGALRLCEAARPSRGDRIDLVDEAKIWKGLITNNGQYFIDGLENLLHWYNKKAESESKANTDYFLCIPGLALAALALNRRLITRSALQKDRLLPIELLDLKE